MDDQRCETCGQAVQTVTSDEGTAHYEPRLDPSSQNWLDGYLTAETEYEAGHGSKDDRLRATEQDVLTLLGAIQAHKRKKNGPRGFSLSDLYRVAGEIENRLARDAPNSWQSARDEITSPTPRGGTNG